MNKKNLNIDKLFTESKFDELVPLLKNQDLDKLLNTEQLFHLSYYRGITYFKVGLLKLAIKHLESCAYNPLATKKHKFQCFSLLGNIYFNTTQSQHNKLNENDRITHSIQYYKKALENSNINLLEIKKRNQNRNQNLKLKDSPHLEKELIVRRRLIQCMEMKDNSQYIYKNNDDKNGNKNDKRNICNEFPIFKTEYILLLKSLKNIYKRLWNEEKVHINVLGSKDEKVFVTDSRWYIHYLSKLYSFRLLSGDNTDSIKWLRRVYELCPNHSTALNSISQMNFKMLNHEEGMTKLEASIRNFKQTMDSPFIVPSINHFEQLCSNVCLESLYRTDDISHIQKIAEDYNKRTHDITGFNITEKENNSLQRNTISSSSEKQNLKLGFIGMDFGKHQVGRQTIWIFCNSKYQITIYNLKPKNFSEDYFSFIQQKRNENGLEPLQIKYINLFSTNNDIANIILRDELHVLVECMGHTGINRLGAIGMLKKLSQTNVFGCPYIVSYLAYPASMFTHAIDYRITDKYIEYSTNSSTPCRSLKARIDYGLKEKLLFMKNGIYCLHEYYEMTLPKVTGRTRDLNKLVFGYPANPKKLSDECVNTFVKILYRMNKEIPTVIRMMYYGMNDKIIQKNIHKGFEKAVKNNTEISKDITFNIHEHIIIDGTAKNKHEYLEVYNEIDVVLDAFPYSGHTTTIEALHMLTPIITLKTKCYHGRGSYSVLMNSGIPEKELNENYIACDIDDYINKACKFIKNRDKLNKIRDTAYYKTCINLEKENTDEKEKEFSKNFDNCIRSIFKP